MPILALVLLAAPVQTKKLDVVDDYFGTKVADPYRWLEDDNCADTKAWVAEQNKVTQAYLAQVPGREKIKQRITKLVNYERYNEPSKKGASYFYMKNDGLQNQSVLYTAKSLNEPARVLVDPNLISKDGTVALSDYFPSEDGKLVVYSLSDAGSDWHTFRVREVESGKDLPDELRWTKFSEATWLKDGSGFYYTRYAEPKRGDELKGINKSPRIYFHKLGSKQADDLLVYARADKPDWGWETHLTEDGRYLVITQDEGTERKNRLFLLALPGGKVEPFMDAYDATYEYIGSDGDTFYLRTNKGAPHFRVVAVQRGKKELKTLIPESKSVIQSVDLVGGHFAVVSITDAHNTLSLYTLDGKLASNVALPGIGTVTKMQGERKGNEGFFSFTGFNYPSTVYRYDFTTKTATVFKQPKVDFHPDEFETKQVFYSSRDGTRVPMFITLKKGTKLDGNNPTYLYGYGGFGISLTPGFSPAMIAWLEMGGVYAVANLRGGGEYGEAWHDAGRLGNKQNVFDDFIAAAEWLIANKYTQPKRLAIAGGSNGGLLVAATLVQRPDLFGAAVPSVGVMDMLRFHKFTVGWGWKSDYGSAETKEGFDVLRKYSPVHNVKPGVHYPATLIVTADHDDRVVPAHSHKFTATLQAAQAGDAPIITRIETRAGHGKGKSTSKMIDEKADVFTFLKRALEVRSDM